MPSPSPPEVPLSLALPGLRFVVGGLALALGMAALHFGEPVLAPLLLAALLAFVLAPGVSLLRRLRLPHALAVSLVLGGALALCVLLGTVMTQQLRALSSDLPTYQDTVRSKLRALRPSAQDGPVHGTLRLLGMVEGELDAARKALAAPAKPSAAQRVQVEPVPPTPLQALQQLITPVLMPLAQLGLVLVLTFGMLLQRHEIRDRLLFLMGQDRVRSAEALNEAARRVSRYLLTQLCVNAAYALPLGLGLWLIGVPGAWLFGLLGGLLRFVPYLGPVIAGALPLLLAFAVDPGWQMVLMTLALIVTLELVVNNIVEPLAYARGTGVSSMAVLLSAGFWALLWGPLGLVLATPLTVCVVVLGRHLGPLRVVGQLLGSEPVFDAATRLHQRLLSGDVEEAIEAAGRVDTPEALVAFYDQAALGALRLVAGPGRVDVRATERHRLASGLSQLVGGLRSDDPEAPALGPWVLCVGARSEFDTVSAEMLAHALARHGLRSQALPAAALSAERMAELPLDGVAAVCLCSFSPAPLPQARYVLRRLRRRLPQLPLLLAAWDEEPELSSPAPADAPEGPAGLLIARSLREAVALLQCLPPLAEADAGAPCEAPPPVSRAERLKRGVQRTRDVFDAESASLLLRDAAGPWQASSAGPLHPRLQQADALSAAGTPWDAVLRSEAALCLPDIEREPAFAAHAGLATEGLRSFLGTPVRDRQGRLRGVLAVHGSQARPASAEEQALLARLAAELTLCLDDADDAPAVSAASYPLTRLLPAAGSGAAA